jgi:hypothetical protein
MYPHERSLVERMQGKPFVLLGINSDESREELKQIVAAENITWRSWWDGGIEGPIHKQWNVTVRPAIYLLDAQGIVRFKDVMGDELDAAVDQLVAEIAP